jgi:putative aldouronate transport system permease protein
MIIPAVLLVFVFSYVPLFGWIIAFKHYSPSNTFFDAPWAGLDNFKLFFVLSSDYLYTIRNTLVMNLGVIIVNISTSFIFAILLYEFQIKWFNKQVQVVALFPYFISWTITYALIYAFMAPSSGVVNQLLMRYGIIDNPINVLGSPEYSWALIILANMWKYIGYNAIIFVAAIASVEREQFEAAEIDGAGRFAQVRHILVPHLVPTLMVMIILNSGSVFNSDIGMFMMFTKATNWETMEVLDIFIYKYGMQQGNYSYATAAGIVKTIISLILVIGTNSLSKRLTDRSIF